MTRLKLLLKMLQPTVHCWILACKSDFSLRSLERLHQYIKNQLEKASQASLCLITQIGPLE